MILDNIDGSRTVLKLHFSMKHVQKQLVVVIIPPLSLGGGTARTAIPVHTVNLIEIRLGERWQPIWNQL